MSRSKLIRDITEVDFFGHLGLGNVPGSSRLYKFGRNSLVGSTEVKIASGGIYGLPPTAETVDVVSSNGGDVDQGAGAWSVHIFGLNEDWKLTDESIVMGATSINTYLRVFRAHVEEAGNLEPVGGGNIGTLTIAQTTSGIEMVLIDPFESQTLCACFTVPVGYRALIWAANTTTGEGKNATNRLKFRETHDGIEHPFRTSGIRDNFENSVGVEFKIPSVVDAKTDIVFTSKSSASGTKVSGTFLIELVDLSV